MSPTMFFIRIVFLTLILVTGSTLVHAQTSGFTYQGALSDGGTLANGNYDLQFSLWDSASGGGQIGSTQTLNAVPVTSGIFSVTLDFGANSFPGAARFLEISTRPAGAGGFTLLSPRQQVTSTPYAIRSFSAAAADAATTATNATQLGGVAANQYVQTNDARLSDSRPPTPNSPSYIQNTNTPQSANFNISGNGTTGGTLSGNILNATTQFNLNGARVLHAPGTGNLFAGASAGAANTTGQRNTYFGTLAGLANTSNSDNAFFGNAAGQLNKGSGNSFFGSGAGAGNVSGIFNSFFGQDAGGGPTQEGSQNSFFGYKAGAQNGGSENSFFGENAGTSNTSGEHNSFFGAGAGLHNTVGYYNVYVGEFAAYLGTGGFGNVVVGSNAGTADVSGDRNVVIGFNANVGGGSLVNAAAIGADARVDQDNSLVLGSIAGTNTATADTNVGIGTTTPNERLTIKTKTNTYGFIHTDGAITVGSFVGGSGNGGYLGTKSNHPLHFFVNNGGPSMTVDTGGIVHINTLGAAGGTSLCRNASNQISTCSSSLRYKTNVQPFFGGLDVINRLRPITFNWKEGGVSDIGLGAEDVAQVAPLFTFRNDKGEVEGVKYPQLSVLLINAAKEQQAQFLAQQQQLIQQSQLIARQESQLKELAQQLVTLRRMVTTKRQRARGTNR